MKRTNNQQFSHERFFNAHVGKHTSLYTKLQPLSFTPLLAKDIGINKAILLHQLQYWMNSLGSGKSVKNSWYDRNTKQKITVYRKWIRDSIVEWSHILIYMSQRTVRRTLRGLVKSKLISYNTDINRNKFSHVKWYSINYERLNHIFVENHPDLAKSMHIFPEVQKVPSDESLYAKSSATATAHSSRHARTGQSGRYGASNRSNPHGYRSGQSGRFEASKLAGSEAANLAGSISNSSTYNSRNSVKKASSSNSNSSSNSELESEPNKSKTSEKSSASNHTAKDTSSATESSHAQSTSTTVDSQETRQSSVVNPFNVPSRLSGHGASDDPVSHHHLLGMTVGNDDSSKRRKAVVRMQNAYRNTWQDDIAPEKSKRIYKNIKRWVNMYGGEMCVRVMRRISSYVQRERNYGDPRHQYIWTYKRLTTTSSRLRYIGRALSKEDKFQQQSADATAEDHDYTHPGMSLHQTLTLERQNSAKRSAKFLKNFKPKLKKMKRHTEHMKNTKLQRHNKAEKEFYRKLGGVPKIYK